MYFYIKKMPIFPFPFTDTLSTSHEPGKSRLLPAIRVFHSSPTPVSETLYDGGLRSLLMPVPEPVTATAKMFCFAHIKLVFFSKYWKLLISHRKYYVYHDAHCYCQRSSIYMVKLAKLSIRLNTTRTQVAKKL